MQSITPPPPPPGPAAGVSIIGTGRDGRLRFTPGQRVELLAAFDRGGQSAMAFARGYGINNRPRHRSRQLPFHRQPVVRPRRAPNCPPRKPTAFTASTPARHRPGQGAETAAPKAGACR